MSKKIALGDEFLVGSLTPPSNKKSYKLANMIKEEKRPLLAVVFNFIDEPFFNVFATAGGYRITLYECLDGGAISALQTYDDEDKEESFYTISWARDAKGNKTFIVAGGEKGIIRVIDVTNRKIHKSLVGHGDAVNEIRTHHTKPQLVISASKDESVRLWNVETGICVMIFAGQGGHRFEVLSVDFHPNDIHRFASCGMDKTVKIWSMKEFWKDVETSIKWTDDPTNFPAKTLQFPVLTSSVHTSYVDCNRWFGDFILSKSGGEILLWEPKVKENSPGECTSDVLLKYPVPQCGDIYFIKFSCDFNFDSLAIGNKKGDIYVWDLKSCPPVLITKLSHKKSDNAIRQTAMSFDGSTILACCDDGSIWRWDKKKQ